MIPDYRIRRLVRDGEIAIRPFNPDQVQPVSYDVVMGSVGLTPVLDRDREYVDLADRCRLPQYEEWKIPKRDSSTIRLVQPGEFFLCATQESITLPAHIGANFEGKSTLGRAGFLVHVTAGLIDPGWSGPITAECVNLSPYPFRIWEGMPLGQIVFVELCDPVEWPYGSPPVGSHYSKSTGVVGSRGFV